MPLGSSAEVETEQSTSWAGSCLLWRQNPNDPRFGLRAAFGRPPRSTSSGCLAEPTPKSCTSEAGIIHRDVKSANILINRKGECYLADFGTAIFAEEIVEGQPTDLVGTPMYMAPEIVRSVPTKYDDRVDSWALGIVAYELMLGKTPWQMLGVSDHTELIFKELRMRDEMDDLIGALLPLHQGVLADMPMEQAVGAGVDRARQVLVDARAIAPRPRCSLGLRALPS